MEYVQSTSYVQDVYVVTVHELKKGDYIMDIKDLHGVFLWVFEGLSSFSEARKVANEEIEVLNQIEDFGLRCKNER